jgi:hypothetical protein
MLLAKLEGNRTLGRPCHIQEDNIKIDVKEIVWEGADRIENGGAPAYTVMNHRVP